MVKRFLVLFVVCFLLMPLPDAYANVIMPQPPVPPKSDVSDVIASPNRSKFVDLNRSFFINGESGSVPLKRTPGSNIEIAALENNEVYFIRYAYNYQGEFWGFLHQVHPVRRIRIHGWVRMDQLLLRYDLTSFLEEHEDEFYSFTGSYEALKTAEEIVTWTWPGSGIIRSRGSIDAQRIENICISHTFFTRLAFMDEHGHEWVFFDRFPLPSEFRFISYAPYVWINLSDPSNSDIPAFNPPRPVVWQPADTGISVNMDTPISEPYIPQYIIILVAGLSVSTAALIHVFWKPNNTKNLSRNVKRASSPRKISP